MEEERANMREHVMKEVDTDRDGAVSLDEFIKVFIENFKIFLKYYLVHKIKRIRATVKRVPVD